MTLNFFLEGVGLQQEESFDSFNSLREKVGYCQSLPSDFVLLGASYSVY